VSQQADLTPVQRSKDDEDAFCRQFNQQIAALEALGWYQEHYALLRTQYQDWNDGVWDHRWIFSIGICVHCHSKNPSVTVNDTSFCLDCLDQYPDISWHPTGSVRAGVPNLVQHAQTCDQHFPIL